MKNRGDTSDERFATLLEHFDGAMRLELGEALAQLVLLVSVLGGETPRELLDRIWKSAPTTEQWYGETLDDLEQRLDRVKAIREARAS